MRVSEQREEENRERGRRRGRIWDEGNKRGVKVGVDR
jgi:hypothetical protein